MNVWVTQRTHYGSGRRMIDNDTRLICILLPKGTVIDRLNYEKYHKYEDPAPRIDHSVYRLERNGEEPLVKYIARVGE